MLAATKSDKCYAYELENFILDSVDRGDMVQFNSLLKRYTEALYGAYDNELQVKAKAYELCVLIHRMFHDYIIDVEYDVCQYANLRLSEISGQDHLTEFMRSYVNVLNGKRTMAKNKPKQLVVAEAKEYIDSHFSDSITLDLVADRVGVSSYYLCRMFGQMEKVSFSNYISHRRIEEAKRLLIETDESITVIAEKTGFGSQAYFGMVFKKQTGLSASHYRKKQRVTGVYIE